MKESFKTIAIRPEKLAVIMTANRVIERYAAAGYDMTLRQLYYRMIADDLLPDSWIDPKLNTKNTPRNYKRLGEYIDDGRMTGLIDWQTIVDRTRELQKLSHWNEPTDIVYSAWKSFRIDKWDNQPVRCEVWVEKDALEGVLIPVCNRYDVPFFSCRGYTSQSAMRSAALRLDKYKNAGQSVVIFHLGDHDPSGIDMTRDILDRLTLFLRDEQIEVERLALNWSQVETYNPPPNFAKQTDSRFDGYEAEFGDQSWELDALEPQVLDTLVANAILSVRDDDLWQQKEDEEKQYVSQLGDVWRNWNRVTEFLNNRKTKKAKGEQHGNLD